MALARDTEFAWRCRFHSIAVQAQTPEALAAFRKPRSKVTIIAWANIKAEQKALDISKSPRSAIQHAVRSA
jgi:hypothetical protein